MYPFQREAIRSRLTLAACGAAGAAAWVIGLVLAWRLMLIVSATTLVAIAMIWRIAARTLPTGGDRAP